jgi:opacity protein-like surface antigen
MKRTRIILSLVTMLITLNALAQVDSTGTRSTTTTTTTVVTGSETKPAEEAPAAQPAPAPAPAPQQADDNDDYAKFYLGARFMPTFTKFKVTTLDNGTAKTTFVVGYGVGGFLGVNLSKNAGIQAEVIYSTLSQKYTDRNIERRIDLSYIHIPLLLVLNTDVSKPVNLNICAGPQIGINTGSKLEAEGGSGVDTVQAVIAVKPADIGLAYGAGLDFRLGEDLSLGVGFRGVYGLLDISDNSKTTTTNQYYILDRSHVTTYAGYIGLKLLF